MIKAVLHCADGEVEQLMVCEGTDIVRVRIHNGVVGLASPERVFRLVGYSPWARHYEEITEEKSSHKKERSTGKAKHPLLELDKELRKLGDAA